MRWCGRLRDDGSLCGADSVVVDEEGVPLCADHGGMEILVREELKRFEGLSREEALRRAATAIVRFRLWILDALKVLS